MIMMMMSMIDDNGWTRAAVQRKISKTLPPTTCSSKHFQSRTISTCSTKHFQSGTISTRSTKHSKSRTISFQYDTGPQPNTYYHRQVDQLCTGSAPVCLVHSTTQWNRTEQKRREHLLTTRATGPRDCYQGQIPKSSAPRIAIVLLSPSPAPGMGSFYFGDFLASIKIMV